MIREFFDSTKVNFVVLTFSITFYATYLTFYYSVIFKLYNLTGIRNDFVSKYVNDHPNTQFYDIIDMLRQQSRVLLLEPKENINSQLKFLLYFFGILSVLGVFYNQTMKLLLIAGFHKTPNIELLYGVYISTAIYAIVIFRNELIYFSEFHRLRHILNSTNLPENHSNAAVLSNKKNAENVDKNLPENHSKGNDSKKTNASEQNIFFLNSWTAKFKLNAGQGMDFHSIQADSHNIKRIEFSLSSTYEYWRAGIKFESRTALQTMPNFLTKESCLIHLGKTNDKYGMSIVFDGDTNNATHKPIELQHPFIHVKIENVGQKKAKLIVNNKLIHEWAFEWSQFTKVFLTAWGDTHEYTVTFSDISIIGYTHK